MARSIGCGWRAMAYAEASHPQAMIADLLDFRSAGRRLLPGARGEFYPQGLIQVPGCGCIHAGWTGCCWDWS